MLIPSSCLYSSWYYTHTKKNLLKEAESQLKLKTMEDSKASRVRKARPMKRKFNGIRFTQSKTLKVDNDVTGMSTSAMERRMLKKRRRKTKQNLHLCLN